MEYRRLAKNTMPVKILHPLVPAGVRQGCEHPPGKNCEESPENAEAGCPGVAVEAVTVHATYSRNLID
jgi:hypothetical protein